MEQLYISLAAISLLILVLGLLKQKINRLPISETLIALLAGILLGPHGLDWLFLEGWGNKEEILMVACEFTIAMALMATALRLPKDYIVRVWKTQTSMILLGLTLMFLFSAFICWYIFKLDVWLCLLIGAIISPTDPVISTTIVSGKVAEEMYPERIRHTISAESGLNDGLAFPFVMLPLFFLKGKDAPVMDWIITVVLWENIFAIVFGLIIGLGAGKLLHLTNKRGLLSSKVFLSYSIALGFLIIGAFQIVHLNGILGVFATGIGLNHFIDRSEDVQEEKVQEMTERLFTIPIFVLLGLVLPFEDWLALGWKGVAFLIGVLLFRRLPAIFLIKSLLKQLKGKADFWVVGWFGPIGVAALYYAVYSMHELKNMPHIWAYATLIIAGSTLFHGITSYPFAKAYHKTQTRQKE